MLDAGFRKMGQLSKVETVFTAVAPSGGCSHAVLPSGGQVETVFRAVANGRYPRSFWEVDERCNVRGGVELAFMSTTREREVRPR